MIEIAPVNPISFQTPLERVEPECYFQKFNLSDSTSIQMLSDGDSITCELKNFTTDMTVRSYIPNRIDTAISGFDFNVWEAGLSFFGVPEGFYYLEITVKDEDGIETDVIRSNPLELLVSHEDTLLFTYNNSYNDFSVVFDTGIVFTLRVEGDIQNFSPKSDDEIYNDQKRNATKLSSIPWRSFILFVGGPAGLPDYMTDMVNRIMSCDTIRIDNEYFEKVEGAEWEIVREEEYPFSGLQIEIMPSRNNFLERLVFDEEDMNNKVLKRLSLNYFNVSGSLSVTDVAKKYTMLDYIGVVRTGAPYTLKIGITPGGDEIGEFDVVDERMTLQVRYLFEGTSVIYVSGIESTSDISLVYDQLDEVVETSGGPPVPESLPIGATIMYDATIEKVMENFNIVSGLGYEGRPWYGWAICDGQNDTYDRRRRVPVGWVADSGSRYGTPGGQGGNETIQLTVGQLPPHRHEIERRLNYNMRTGGGTTIPTPNWPHSEPGMDYVTTDDGGREGLNNDPVDIMNRYTVSVFVTKIA